MLNWKNKIDPIPKQVRARPRVKLGIPPRKPLKIPPKKALNSPRALVALWRRSVWRPPTWSPHTSSEVSLGNYRDSAVTTNSLALKTWGEVLLAMKSVKPQIPVEIWPMKRETLPTLPKKQLMLPKIRRRTMLETMVIRKARKLVRLLVVVRLPEGQWRRKERKRERATAIALATGASNWGEQSSWVEAKKKGASDSDSASDRSIELGGAEF